MHPAPRELGTLGLTSYCSPTADLAGLGGEGGPPAWHVSTELLVLHYATWWHSVARNGNDL